jgi:hypothetical protein
VPKFVADSSETTGLKWAAPAGGGKILQVVYASYSTETNNATTTYTDTGVTATITPSSATSKILLFSSIPTTCTEQNSNTITQFKLFRGATELEEWTESSGRSYVTSGRIQTMSSFVWQDSPATTSATTYKFQFRNAVAQNLARVQSNNDTSTIILMEQGA